MRLLAACVLVLASATTARAQATARVHGKVLDRATHAPVAGAVIAIGNELAASDDDGTFTIALPRGRYTIEVTAPFLVTKRQPLALTADAEVVIEVDAAEEATGERIEVVDIAPTAPGETKVDAKLARAVPGGGDAGKVVQSLPAVARAAAGSSDIVVWGAAPHDTRVFVDGVPVPALYHLGGYRSAVGNDLVGDIKLTPAAFGPDRGRAIGGVIDIGLGWRAQADVLDASLAGKIRVGPITIAAAVRQSWLDRAIGLVADPQTLAPNAPLPRWSDAQVIARGKLSDKVVVTGWVLGSLDALERTLVSTDPASEVREQLDQKWLRAQISLRRDRDTGFDSATVWFGRDQASDDYRFGMTPASHDSTAWVGGARGVQQSRLSDHATLTLGGDLDAERTRLARTGSLTIPRPIAGPRRRSISRRTPRSICGSRGSPLRWAVGSMAGSSMRAGSRRGSAARRASVRRRSSSPKIRVALSRSSCPTRRPRGSTVGGITRPGPRAMRARCSGHPRSASSARGTSPPVASGGMHRSRSRARSTRAGSRRSWRAISRSPRRSPRR